MLHNDMAQVLKDTNLGWLVYVMLLIVPNHLLGIGPLSLTPADENIHMENILMTACCWNIFVCFCNLR